MIEDLKRLVATYNQCKDLSAEDCAKLLGSFEQVVFKSLLKSVQSLDRKAMDKKHQELQLFFNQELQKPDSDLNLIEKAIAPQSTCLQILKKCHEKFLHPERFKVLTLGNVATVEELKLWSLTQKEKAEKAKIPAKVRFYSNLLDFLDESKGYYNEVGKIEVKGMKLILASLPVAFLGLGAVVCFEELFALYSLFFVLLKSGQFIEQRDIKQLEFFGTKLHKLTSDGAMNTSTVLLYIARLVFWVSCRCYGSTLQAGTAVLGFFTAAHQQDKEQVDKGLVFKHYQLKLVAAPIEAYAHELTQQLGFGYGLRSAATRKHQRLILFLNKLKELDQDGNKIELKLAAALEEIKRIKHDENAKTGNTAAAVHEAERTLELLVEDPNIDVEKYEENSVMAAAPS